MNDQKITDDLLDELEQLETSAEALEEKVNQNKANQEAFQKLDSANQIDAISLAVEAARTAQEAASQSHKAAETSISHANRQKAQIMELSEGNFAWRQATKVANNEIKSAKSSFAIMLSVNVALSVVAASAIGWMLYDMHKKQAQFKGEMLDIIQTENALLNKHITIKVDQISSLLELLTAEIQRMKPTTQRNQSAMDKNNSSAVVEKPDENIQPKVEAATTSGMSTEVGTESAMKNATAEPQNVAIEDTQYTELKKLVEQILDEQQKLQAKTLVATQQGISEQQAKQLKDINWLVSKQSKTLKEIKQNLLKQPGSSLNSASSVLEKQNQQNYQLIQQSLSALKTQLEALSAQQQSLQSQVKALQDETHTLTKQPKPYSYRVQP